MRFSITALVEFLVFLPPACYVACLLALVIPMPGEFLLFLIAVCGLSWSYLVKYFMECRSAKKLRPDDYRSTNHGKFISDFQQTKRIASIAQH